MGTHFLLALILILPTVVECQGDRCGRICEILRPICASNSHQIFCQRLLAYFPSCRCQGLSVNPIPTTRRPTTTPTTTTPSTTTPPAVVGRCGIGGTGSATSFIRSAPKIIGGQNAMQGHFPWQVLVNGRGGTCGGTIVNSNTIVTAAHCVSTMVTSPSSVTVGYGNVNRQNVVPVPACRIVIHPDYSSGRQPDLAVIKLSRNIPFGPNASPACLPYQNQPVPARQFGLVSGWGVLNEGASTLPLLLQYVVVPTVDQTVCSREYYANYGGVADTEFCAGYDAGRRDSCQGDSGSGLVMARGDQWVLTGVVSRGTGCALARFPGIYSRVPLFVDWIQNLMQQGCV